MAGWWNRMPQFDGLFDFQNNVRPAYFTFKLLSRLTGDRLRRDLQRPERPRIGGSRRPLFRLPVQLLLWNFSNSPAQVEMTLKDVPGPLTAKPIVLDAVTPSNDEIARLRPERSFQVKPDQPTIRATLEPYGIRQYNVLLWNFSNSPVQVEMTLKDVPGPLTAKPILLDAATPSNDEIAQSPAGASFEVKADQPTIRAPLEPSASDSGP